MLLKDGVPSTRPDHISCAVQHRMMKHSQFIWLRPYCRTNLNRNIVLYLYHVKYEEDLSGVLGYKLNLIT